MIKIQKSETGEQYELVVDGTRFPAAEAAIHPPRTGLLPNMQPELTIRAISEEVNRRLLAHRFSDLPDEIWILEVQPDDASYDSDGEEPGSLFVTFNIWSMRPTNVRIVWYEVNFDSDEWKGSWSIADYVSEFKSIFEQEKVPGAEFITNDDEISSGGFRVMFPVTQPDMLMGEMISSCAKMMDDIDAAAQSSLMAKIDADSLVVHFDFPEEVKVACEQYLLYFVQFLKDLGVEANAELQHEAGQVLFAVTPTNKEEALDKIRDALGTYLKLAASPVDVASVLSSDIEVQRLSANIQHLQGQLTLAHAILQSKDATIQLQQTNIEVQRRALGGEVLIDSMKDVTPKPKDTEEVLGGLAEITKYEGKGFKLNLPEAFRRLRQSFNDMKGGKK